jgi:hypothetical protein
VLLAASPSSVVLEGYIDCEKSTHFGEEDYDQEYEEFSFLGLPASGCWLLD